MIFVTVPVVLGGGKKLCPAVRVLSTVGPAN
jgi:hypothetical protein